jgi:hypothetical protein
VGTGFITYELWHGAGETVDDIPVETTPDLLTEVSSLSETSTTFEYGVRVRGLLTAPLTGEYRFWITSDDNSELWLGTDESSASLIEIASVTGVGVFADPGEWNKLGSQASAPIELEAGKRYRLLLLFKQGGGPGHFMVGWAKPGDVTTAPAEEVPGSQLTPENG